MLLSNHFPFPQKARFLWDLRFLFGCYNDDWYISLFKESAGKLCGEITPDYSILDKVDIQKVHTLLPNIKIILILRNPIDRAWSHVRHAWKMHPQNTPWNIDNFPSTSSISKIIKFINSPAQDLRSNYLRTINNWRDYFSPDQIFIGFYEDIIKNPTDLLNKICQFLEIDY